jgi:hypothetical protein
MSALGKADMKACDHYGGVSDQTGTARPGAFCGFEVYCKFEFC